MGTPSATDLSRLTVTIRNVASANPGGMVIGTFTDPVTGSLGDNTFTAPAGGIKLEPSTNYALMLDVPQNQGLAVPLSVRTGETRGDEQASTFGWTIRNNLRRRVSNRWESAERVPFFQISGSENPPDAPAGLTATAGDAQVTLTWTDPSNSAIDKYQLRQGTGTTVSWGSWTDITSSSATTTSHTVTGLTNGMQYSFQVRAVDGTVDGTASATVTATPAALAQTQVLVSNTGEATAAGYRSARAAKFTTGSNSAGYTVSSVSVAVGDFRNAGQTFTVKIQADGDTPGAVVADLTSPSTLVADSNNTFTAPADTVLAANTTYFLVIYVSITTTGHAAFSITGSNAQTGETGWSIADNSLYVWPPMAGEPSAGDWASSGGFGTQVPQFAINGSAITATAGVTTQATDATATEGSTTDTATFTVALATQPSSPVTVTVTAPSGLTLDGPDGATAFTSDEALSFSTSSWSTAQTVTVRATDNSADDPGVRELAVTYSATSSDDDYSGLTGTAATIEVTDDDETEVTLAGTAGNVEEGGTKEFTVTLNRGLVDGEVLPAPLSFGGAAMRGTDYTTACPTTLPTGVTCHNLDTAATPTVTFTGPSTGATATSVTLTLTARTDSATEGSETVTIGLGALDANSGTGLGGGASGSGSLSFSITDPPAAPAAPTGLIAVPGMGQATLYWTDPSNSDIDKYQYRSGTGTTVSWGSWADIPSSGAATTTHTVTGLTNGAQHSFQIRAVDGPAMSAASNTATATPKAAADATVSLAIEFDPFEDSEDAEVEVALSATVSGAAVEVYLTATDGTATKGADYAAGTETGPGGAAGLYKVTIAAGMTSATLSIALTDDAILEGDETFTVAIADIVSTGVIGRGATTTVTMTIADSESAATASPTLLNLRETAGSVLQSEGTYTLVLTTPPTADVTVAVDALDPDIATAEPVSLTFTSTTWDMPQMVTVTAVPDDIVNPGGRRSGDIDHTLTSADRRFPSSIIPRVAVAVEDDDTAGLAFVPDELTVNEGADATYTVALTSEPTGNVTVTVAGASGEVEFDTDTGTDGNQNALSFTTSDWNSGKTVTVSAGQDDDAAPDSATLTHTASGGGYGSVTGDLDVTVTDDDSATVTLTVSSSGAITEGGSALTITATRSEANATGAALEFPIQVKTADTTAQEDDYTALAANISIADGDSSGTTTFAVTNDSADEPPETVVVELHTPPSGTELGATTEVEITITDNDATAVTLAGAAGNVEEGGTKTFTVSLVRGLVNGEALDVPLTFGGEATRNTDYTTACASATGVTCHELNSVADGNMPRVTFTGPATNATATSVTLTLTALTDSEKESGGETVDIDLGALGASSGTNLDGGASGTDTLAEFRITDPPGVTVVESGGSTVVKEGDTTVVDTFTAVLDTQPEPAGSNVNVRAGATAASRIELEGGDVGDVFSGSELILFPNAQWNVPQTYSVRATAASDGTDTPGSRREEEVTFTAAHFGGSTYDSVTVDALTVAVIDSDPTSVTLARVGTGVVAEGGTATLTVTLGRDLIAGETVTAPLTVSGTGVTAGDYTLALSAGGSLNNGVMLNTSTPYSAAQPAVAFTGSDTGTQQVATLTLTAATDGDANETLSVGFGSVESNLDRADASTSGTGGTSTAGAPVAIVIGAAAPAAPGGLMATAGDRQVKLTWTDPSDSNIDGYEYRQGSGSPFSWGSWASIAGSDDTTVSHTVTGLANGTQYSFQIRAVVGTTNGTESPTVTATPAAAPAAPTGLTATAGDAQIALSWANPGNSDIDKYQYRQGTGSPVVWGSWTDIGSSGATTTAHTVASLTNGTEYSFQIRAADGTANSAASNTATATPVAAGAPAAPTGLTATPGDGEVSLTWTNPGNNAITGYQYRIWNRNWGAWTTLSGAGAGSTGFTLSPLTNGEEHRFQLRAVAGALLGVASTPVSAIPGSGPAAPTGLRAVPGSGQVTLYWANPGNSDISRYQWQVEGYMWAEMAGSNAATTKYVATGLGNGTALRFRIRAFSSNAAGAASAWVSVTPKATADATVQFASSAQSGLEGDSAALEVVLSASVSADVTVYFTATDGAATKGMDYPAGTVTGPDGAAGRYSVTISAGSTRATLSIAITDDTDLDPNESFTLTIADVVSDAVIGRGARAQSAVTILDNDPGIVLPPTGVNVAEPSGTDTYAVRLAAEPTADVVVAVAPQTAGVVTVAPTSLTFTDSTWSTPQMVTVTAVNDDIDNPSDVRSANIEHTPTSTDSRFTANILPASVTDDDTAGFAFTPPALTVAENASGTYTLALTSEPTANVMVTVAGASGEVTFDTNPDMAGTQTTPLTFTAGTWDTPQTVTVLAADDADTANDSVTLSHSASGGGYNSVTGNLVVTVTDDDAAAPDAPTDLTATKGNARVTLSWTDPSNSNIDGYEYRQGSGSSFAWGSWTGISGSTATTVSHTVTGLTNGTQYSFQIRAVDGTANGAASDTVTATPAPPPGKPANLAGEAGDGEAVLTWDNPNNSAITGYEYSYAVSGTLVDWTAMPGSGAGTTTYTLTGLDNGGTYQIRIRALAGSAQGTQSDLVTVTLPVVLPTVTIAAGASPVAEGAAASFTLTVDRTLDSALSVTVGVADAPNADFVASGGEGNRMVSIPTSGSATFTVATVGDSADEPSGPVTATVATGTDYDIGSARVARVTVTDNDATSVTLAGAAANVEEGGEKTFTVTLGRGLVNGEILPVPLTFGGAATRGTDYTTACPSTLPTGVTCNNLDTASAPTVTFTGPTTGTTAESVTLTLTAETDSATEGSETVTIGLGTLTGTGLDGGASGSGSLSFSITDPPPGVTVAETGGSTVVTEGGGDEDTFTVVLDARPGSPLVRVTAAAGSGVELEGTDSNTAFSASEVIEFSSQNGRTNSWNAPQTVTVRAAASENATDTPGSRAAAQVTFTTDEVAGTAYDGLTVPPLSVTVIDNDPTTVTLARTGTGVVAEGGTATLTVMLGRDLIANETVTAPLTVSGTGVTASDYTLILASGGSLNNGVTLNAGSPYSAAQPAVVFTGSDTGKQQVATLTLTAATDGDANETLSIGFGSVTSNLDLADASTSGTGGTTTAGAPVAITIGTADTAAPTLSIGVPDKINVRTAFTATFTFNEPVTGFAASDITVTGGTKGALTGSGATYTMPVTPSGAAGDVTVRVAQDAVTDGSGNSGPASAVSDTAVWDNTAPTLDINNVPETISDRSPFTVEFDFSEPVTYFDTESIAVTGGAKGTLMAAGSYAYDLPITPDGDADVVIEVEANAASDGVNTGPASTVTATAAWEPPAPTGLTAEAGNAQVMLRWTDPFNDVIDGYQYRQGTGTTVTWGSWTDIANSDDETTTHTVTGLTNGTAYSFQIRAVNGPAESAASDAAAATPAAPALVFTPASLRVDEGGSGTYTVALNIRPGAGVTVTVASDNADVTADTDTGTNGDQNTLTFTTTDWATGKTVTVSAGQDDDTTNDTATLSHSASGGGYNSVTGDLAVTVTDDDSPSVTLSASAASITEGGTALTLTATRSEANNSGATLNFPIGVKAQGTTAQGNDYTALAANIGIANNASTGTTTFAVTDDNMDEPPETVVVELGTPPSGTVLGATGEVEITIADNDATAVTLAGVAGNVEEGDTKTFTVTLGRALADGEILPVPLAFVGTATRGADYATACASAVGVACQDLNNVGQGSNPRVTFTGPSANAVTLTLSATADNTAETGDETVDIDLGALDANSGTNLAGGASGTTTLATFSITDPIPDAPAAPTGLTATAGDGQVALAWADPSNSDIDGYEYRRGSGSPFAWGGWTGISGSTAATVSHTVTGLANGTAYSFQIRALDGMAASAASNTATATPMGPVTLTIDPAALTVTEGGDTHAVLKLKLSAPRATDTAVTVLTVGGTASDNSDFTPGPHRVTIPAGDREATLRITILDDDFDENDEAFTVLINTGSLPTGVTAGTPSQATVTIRDDDAPPPAPAGLTAEAGDRRVVLAWTYAPPEVDRTGGFDYRVRAGSAAWGAWTAVPGGAGRRGHTVTGLVNGTDYTFEVRARTRNGLTGPASAQAMATPDSAASVLAAEVRTWLSESSCDTACQGNWRRALKALGDGGSDLGAVTPLTHREALALAFTDAARSARWGRVSTALRDLEAERVRVSIAALTAGPVAEGAVLSFRLTASEAPAADLAVSVTVADVQASPDAVRESDFVADVVREVVIPASQISVDFTVQTVDDGAEEPGGFVNATLEGSLDYAPGARWGASVEVADNDAPDTVRRPVATVSGGAGVTEGEGAVFTLTVAPPPSTSLAVSVDITQDGDFAASGQTGARTVTVGAGGTATFTVATEDDGADEDDGAIRATLTAGVGYAMGTPATASVAVADNDDAPPTPPGTTFVPDATLVADIRRWRSETQHGQAHVDRWTRVLIALGAETGTLEPMSSSEAQGYADRGWTRWTPVVAELERKEAHDAQPVTPVTPPPALPTVTVSGDGAVTEGAGAAFTVSRTGGTAEVLTVLLAVSEDTSGGRDFVAADDEGNKQVVIQAGSATATFTVPTTGDSVDEPDGAVTLALRTSSAYTRGAPSSGTVAVSDDDGATPPPTPILPTVTVSGDSAVTEGTGAAFMVSRTGDTGAALTVLLEVSEDTSGGRDFVAADDEGDQQVVIQAGSATATYTVPTSGDSVDEPDGAVTLALRTSGDYTSGSPSSATVAVGDDDATTVTLAGPSGDIAEAGGAKAFTVTLDRAPVAGEWVRVPLMLGGAATRSADWTATCAQAPGVRCLGLNSSDRPSIDFFFATGEGASATATVTLTAVADSVDEGEGETVTVALGTPETNAGGGATGTGTLGFTISDDDDPLPAVSVAAGADVTEGTDATFTLTVSPAPAADLTVSYTVADADGADFLLRASEGANTVVIGAGATSASVTVPTVADSTDEPDGEVTLTLAAGAGYRLGAASATVAVADDDATTGPTLSISDAQVSEGGNMPFTITLSVPSRERVCFDARTRDSTPHSAAAGTDYTPNLWNASRYLPCFPPGQTALRLWIKTWKDVRDEPDETFEMVLSNPRGATIADAVGVGTICDRNDTDQCPPVETDTDTLRSPDGFVAGGLAAEPAAKPQTGPGPRARSAPRLEPRFEPPAAACVPPELLSEVRAHAGASRRPAAVERWLRVLHTFTGAANDATIMLSAEARTYLDPGRPEWAPVVAAIQCLEATTPPLGAAP